MKVHISFRRIEKRTQHYIEGLVGEQAEKLEKKLGTLDRHDPSIKATFEKHGEKALYRFGAHMHLLRKIITADETGENPEAVVKEVFDELERQALRYKRRLKHEHEWKRKSRRKPLEIRALTRAVEVEPETSPPETTPRPPVNWFDEISPHLDGLYDFAAKEIAYLHATDELLPDDIRPDELVDAVLVAAFEKQAGKPEDLDTPAWLHQLALDLLDEEAARSRRRRNTVSLESEIEDEDIDTEIYEFYQPDEILRLEDMIGTPEGIPDEEAEEIEEAALEALANLPKPWRRSAMLHHGVGFPEETVATILRTEKVRIGEMLESAERYLGDHHAVPAHFTIERIHVARRIACPEPLHSEFREKFRKASEKS